ncbi:hypothetical protein, partial [Leptospira idonii]
MNQISGLGSGIVKSALVAAGVPESEMNARIKDATELRFAGNMELTYAERRYLANAQQYAGLAVTGTSYHSSIPSGEKGLMEELQKQLFINTVASVGNVDKDILNTFIRQ